MIKGTGIELPGGVMLEKELTIAPGTTVLETSITSSAALGNVIAKGVLTINWTITHLGQEKGYKSDHPTYVTGAPASGQFETVLDVGCRNATGLRPADTGDLEPLVKSQEVVDAIWRDFADNSVAAADGTIMQYAHDAPRFETADLVRDKKGTCGAWARFLVDVLTAQGVSATSHEVEPSDPGIPDHTLADRPGVPGERGGQLRVNPGPAQGSAGANYPHREFEDHRIVKVQGISWDRNVYDPSYGRRFEAMTVQVAEQMWEDASVEAYRYYLRNTVTGEEKYHGWFLDRKGVDEVDM